MPLGASRLILFSTPAGEEEVAQRTAVTGVTATGTAKLKRIGEKFGGSQLDLDGNSDYISIPWSDDLGKWNQQAYTLEYWVKLDSLTGTSYADGAASEIPNGYGNHQPTSNVNYWSFGPIDDGSVVFFYYNGGKVILQTSGVTLSTGTWYHLAFVHDGSNGIKIYVDGTQRASGTIAGTPQFSSGQGIYLGAAGSSTQYMNGQIDELRVSTAAKYTSNFSVQTQKHLNDNTDTALLLHFDGQASSGTNTDFYDDNGNRRPIVPDYVEGEIDTAQSKFGGSSFYANSGYYPMQVNANTNTEIHDVGAGAYTYEFFVRRASNADETLIFFNGVSYKLYYDYSANRLKWQYNAIDRITSTGALSINTWYHVAIVRDASANVKMFIDGTQSGSTYTNDISNWSSITDFVIGENGQTTHWDEFRLSNTERYTGNFTAPTSQFTDDEFTLALYHFDDSDGAQNIKDDNGMS